jgi:hypothetical protein
MFAERIAGEPIVVMKFDDRADASAITELYLQSLELAADTTGPIHYIVDVREAPARFQTVETVLRSLIQGVSGAAVTPDLALTYVIDVSMTSYFAGAPAQAVDSMESAVVAARSAVTPAVGVASLS